MFCIRIADLPVGIDNRYQYVSELCREYKTEDAPLFTVSATNEEILEEGKGNACYSPGYCESLSIYRKICCRIARYDAFLMHAAVVAVDSSAYAFAAPSGTGKSTHIRLWTELFGDRARVVNGDKPIFRFVGDVLYACGTPWRGKEMQGSNIMCPVRGICFLEQSPENRIRRLSTDEISGRLFRQILIPKEEQDFNYFWPLLEKMISSVDFYLLQCNQEPEAARLSYYTMRGNES